MNTLPTVYFVVDIETTFKLRNAFDVAWKAIDRKGREYGRGSYLITEVLNMDVPYFKEKLGWYFDDTYAQQITPSSMKIVKMLFNMQVEDLLDKGHKVIFCAYNAQFDATHLNLTCEQLLGKDFLEHRIPLMDLYANWGASVPMGYTAKRTPGGYLGTSAEDAFRFEFNQDDFVERHIAWSDVVIESQLLLKVLARKQKLHMVSDAKYLKAFQYRPINARLGIGNKEAKAYKAARLDLPRGTPQVKVVEHMERMSA